MMIYKRVTRWGWQLDCINRKGLKGDQIKTGLHHKKYLSKQVCLTKILLNILTEVHMNIVEAQEKLWTKSYSKMMSAASVFLQVESCLPVYVV